MKIVKSEDNQTVLDFAIQYYGNPEAIGEVLALNPLLRNDESELARLGYQRDDFALEVKLASEQNITVDDESKLAKKNVIKNIDKPVTTYDNGKDNK